MSSHQRLVQLVEEISSITGVRGLLLSTGEGILESVDRSGLPLKVAQDIAKTVRRMTLASATVGVPLEELLINFGAARMMVTPLSDESTIIVLLEKDQAVSSVRVMLSMSRHELRELIEQKIPEERMAQPVVEDEDEIDQIMASELGDVLALIFHQFANYVIQSGRTEDDAALMMREQMREWLQCCNPSPYTFPLLIDGLGQLLNDSPEARGRFMQDVQSTLRESQAEHG